LRQSSAGRTHSATRTAAHFYSPAKHSSPLRESSGFRASSPARSPLRESLRSSALKQSDFEPRRSSPFRRGGSPLRLSDEDQLVDSLKQQIAIERELEQAKQYLVDRADFNLFDAFRIFDFDNRGFITKVDLKLGLNDLNLYPTQEDMDLFFARYDSDGDLRLRFSEFCKAFEPLDSYQASILNRRSTNGPHSHLRRSDCFLESTK
jgi:hypothetical protein